ncbi:hypothetical protein BDK51DRAFT_24857 [Blyttiomyces helicus]|uniref:Uncharacterized protein n=1 Tax=Blyttiomyces helicus TaxID=388810 RepID=A0A4P9W1A1_9FUNG|nr:hypothetical protein BDK51DRAFT_24857 [Blyttiomyces helicus]|eukprot:RKO85884.1 hypothetical protein BDK51DRAFT_24857 [Blyttiomyces helicus]
MSGPPPNATDYFTSDSDLVATVFGASVWVFDIFALAVGLALRAFPPLKAKQIHLLIPALFGSICWWLGSLAATSAIRPYGIFQHCSFWGVWMQQSFGVELVIAFFRLVRLLMRGSRDLIQCKPTSGIGYHLTTLALCLPSIGLAVASLLSPSGDVLFHDDNTGLTLCTFDTTFKYVDIVFAGAGVIFLGVSGWIDFVFLRHIDVSFNEFKELRLGFVTALVALATFSGLNLAHSQRTVSYISLLAANVYFWTILGPPLFGRLFDREACEAKFWAGIAGSRGGTKDKVLEAVGNGSMVQMVDLAVQGNDGKQ